MARCLIREIKQLALILILVAVPTSAIAADLTNNLNEAAKYIADKVAQAASTRLPATGKHRIATIGFGDNARKHPKPMGDLGIQLQGQTIEAIKEALTATNAGGQPLATKFSVLSYEQLEAIFGSSPNDISGLTNVNESLARNVLKDESLDVGVVGHFDFDGESVSAENLKTDVKVEVTIVFPSDSVKFDFAIKRSEILLHLLNSPGKPPIDVPGSTTPPTLQSRFKVAVLGQRAGTGTFDDIPLQLVTDSAHPLFNALVLFIDEAKYKGQRYVIRVENKADRDIAYLDGSTPGVQKVTVVKNSTNEKDRFFLLSSYVDGVSTIKRRVTNSAGVESYEKDIRNYPLVRKYVLTGPGRRFEQAPGTDDTRFKDAKLVNTGIGDPGHAKLNMKGFLKVNPDGSKSESGVFIFGDSKNSVGQEFVGTGISQIGIISLYFFAEKLAGDTYEIRTLSLSSTNAGTVEGPDIPTPTITVGVKNVYPIPVETWHIVYKYKASDDPDCIPITP